MIQSTIHIMVWVLAAIWLAGCSGMNNLYHKEGDHFKNWRVKYSSHPFSPSVERDYTETCPPLKTDATKPDLEQCVPDQKADGSIHYEMAKEPGYLGGLGGSILQAGSILGGAALVGNGLRHSGSQNTSNNNATFQDNLPGHKLVP